ncbi:MAG: hypothetical protein Q9218_004289 [Villophora microphyllina]
MNEWKVDFEKHLERMRRSEHPPSLRVLQPVTPPTPVIVIENRDYLNNICQWIFIKHMRKCSIDLEKVLGDQHERAKHMLAQLPDAIYQKDYNYRITLSSSPVQESHNPGPESKKEVKREANMLQACKTWQGSLEDLLSKVASLPYSLARLEREMTSCDFHGEE